MDQLRRKSCSVNLEVVVRSIVTLQATFWPAASLYGYEMLSG
jgi:hypothetical protein